MATATANSTLYNNPLSMNYVDGLFGFTDPSAQSASATPQSATQTGLATLAALSQPQTSDPTLSQSVMDNSGLSGATANGSNSNDVMNAILASSQLQAMSGSGMGGAQAPTQNFGPQDSTGGSPGRDIQPVVGRGGFRSLRY